MLNLKQRRITMKAIVAVQAALLAWEISTGRPVLGSAILLTVFVVCLALLYKGGD